VLRKSETPHGERSRVGKKSSGHRVRTAKPHPIRGRQRSSDEPTDDERSQHSDTNSGSQSAVSSATRDIEATTDEMFPIDDVGMKSGGNVVEDDQD
jgi:hypothetical protein